jgi:hypothetical protein
MSLYEAMDGSAAPTEQLIARLTACLAELDACPEFALAAADVASAIDRLGGSAPPPPPLDYKPFIPAGRDTHGRS